MNASTTANTITARERELRLRLRMASTTEDERDEIQRELATLVAIRQGSK